jgi:hydrogenase maturation protein HypF
VTPPDLVQRSRLDVRGVVQGVGFRPHAYRLAREHGLAGTIRNDGEGLRVDVEGSPAALDAFAAALVAGAPAAAQVEEVRREDLPPRNVGGLEILPSEGAGGAAGVQADLAPCAACLREVDDPADRRHRYPFTPTTAPTPPCAASPSARPARPSSPTPPTGASTPSPSPARPAAHS